MELLKKITRLLTPPPFRKEPEPEAVLWTEEEGHDLAFEVKPMLRRFVTAPTLDDPATKEALREIKQLALKRGLYATAFEIKVQLDMMPRMDSQGKPHHKPRGYVLAADFFLGSIRRELTAAKAQAKPIGPNVFKGYCNELTYCLFQGENVRRGIEVPVLIVDELLATAVELPAEGVAYVELAAEAAESTLALARERMELQVTGRIQSKARKETPVPQPTGPHSFIDDPVVQYVEELARKLRDAHSRFLEAQAERQTKGLPAFAALNRAAYLEALLRISEGAQLTTFLALVQEQLGALIQPTDARRSQELLVRAAEHYDAQGDQELRLALTKLSRWRYEKAAGLFSRVGDAQRVAQVNAKLTLLSAPAQR